MDQSSSHERGTSVGSRPGEAQTRALRLRTLDRAEHARFIESQPWASFLQCPSWADVKIDWRSEGLGWTDASGTLVGAALVLYRRIPGVKRHLAYIPEGPLIDWSDADLSRWLQPLLDHLRSRRAFAVKMGPPIALHRWRSGTLKDAIGGRTSTRLQHVSPDETDPVGASTLAQLRSIGWVRSAHAAGHGSMQPRYVVEVPLAGRSPEHVWTGFSQQWRRHVRRAEKAGVEVALGGYEDLDVFYELLKITQERDGFNLGRSLDYYRRQHRVLTAEHPDRMQLYLARHAGDVLAAHSMTVVGTRVWYQLGASASHRREVRPSHALQWRMIQDAIGRGASVYDMRGISGTLDHSEPGLGLLQWKLGTGGHVSELLGEWDYPLNRTVYAAFSVYMTARRIIGSSR